MARSTSVLLLLFLLVTSGCGGAQRGRADRPEIPRRQAVFSLRLIPGLGPVLALNAKSKTVYRFSGDVRGDGVTRCSGACARVWEPVLSSKRPLGESGAFDPDDFGTILRRDGSSQATYKGWALYTYRGEGRLGAEGAGQRSFGGTWYALRASGKSVGG